MKPFILKFLAATAFTIGSVGIAFGANASLSDVNDTVCGLVSDGNVLASIDGSIVTLTGYTDGSTRQQIETKVREMPGVTDVINEITSA